MEEKLNGLSFINAAIFGLVLAAIYYFLVFQESNPQEQLSRKDEQVGQLKTQIAGLDGKIRMAQRKQKQIDQIKFKSDRAFKSTPDNLSADVALAELSKEARSAQLSIESLNAGGSWVESNNIESTDLTLQVLGRYDQIMLFLSEITRKDHVYSVRSLEMRRVGDLSSDTKDDLSASVQIYVFRRKAQVNTEEVVN